MSDLLFPLQCGRAFTFLNFFFKVFLKNHNAQIISQILPTNSCNQDITPLSFGLVYQVTSAEVTGDNKAIIREIRKLKITIAINQL